MQKTLQKSIPSNQEKNLINVVGFFFQIINFHRVMITLTNNQGLIYYSVRKWLCHEKYFHPHFAI